jgi:hypothetical protein
MRLCVLAQQPVPVAVNGVFGPHTTSSLLSAQETSPFIFSLYPTWKNLAKCLFAARCSLSQPNRPQGTLRFMLKPLCGRQEVNGVISISNTKGNESTFQFTAIHRASKLVLKQPI